MKKSNYNIFIKKKNCVLGYNTLTDSYVIISHNAYESFLKKKSIETFSEKFPQIYKSFKSCGFIIDKNFDELNAICFDNKVQTFKSKDYFLMVYPTQDCNLKCWYCYESHVKNSIMSLDVMDAIVNHISKKIENKEINMLHLTFFGGEPLLYFDSIVFPLLERISDLCIKNKIPFYPFFITNGSLITKELILKIKQFNPMFQITLDGNAKKHDSVRKGKIKNYPTFEKIISGLKLISKYLSSEHTSISRILTIRINYDNHTLNYTDEIIKELAELDRNKVFIHLERVWQTKSFVNNEQIDKLKKTILKFSAAGFRVGHGIFGRRSNSCPAEVHDYAVINYDGLVYRCNGRTLTPKTAEGKLLPCGTIEWKKEMLIKRLSRTTFDNKKCLNCVMLPQCMGPCSQKQMENGWGNIDNICSLNVIDLSIEDYLTLDFEVRNFIAKK